MSTRRGDRDRGASAVEYGLLVAAIAAMIVGAVFALGGSIKNAYGDINNKIVHSGTAAPVAPVVPPVGG